MNELSLFSGAGGGLLGSKLLGWNPIGYVEWDDYCQRVIAQRIKDGFLPDAPIFGDIRAFIDNGYAASYKGLVDVVSAGFPCQPFSVAGKQKGADDERNMWPATAEVIGIVRPRFVLLENVPGIRSYLPVVVRDLRRLGYEVSRPLILGADDCGAPHRRKRIWIIANTESNRLEVGGVAFKGQTGLTDGSGKVRAECDVAHATQRQDNGRERGSVDFTTEKGGCFNTTANIGGQDVAHTDQTGRGEQRRAEPVQPEYPPPQCCGEDLADSEKAKRE